ncbi:hypothetical protein AOQ73_16800 [Bradyrhizobium pachyrhizi]|nr:hypothetical protein AOQ73_16800 [Bradyrhizobium pachyrhizi]
MKPGEGVSLRDLICGDNPSSGAARQLLPQGEKGGGHRVLLLQFRQQFLGRFLFSATGQLLC